MSTLRVLSSVQARDEQLSRMLGAVSSSQQSMPQQGPQAQVPAASAQLLGGIAVLGGAAAGVLRELRQQTMLAAALQVGSATHTAALL